MSNGSIIVETKTYNMPTSSIPGLQTSNLVPLAIAQDCISRYITEIASKETNPVYAFQIYHDDLLHALGRKPEAEANDISRVRVYLGISSDDDGSMVRLFLVPVNDAGKDVIPTDDEGNQRVYDFNLPCPATCDVTSPLYYQTVTKRK